MSLISLESPSEKYIDSFFEAMAEFADEGIPQAPKDLTREDFSAYVQRIRDRSEMTNLAEGRLPDKEFWIIDADGYAGRIILGLSLIPDPDRLGHHVGYAVRPGKRRRGYATQALRYLLTEARKLGIHKLMPMCDPANIASRKVIESNGGRLIEGSPIDKVRYGGLRFLIDLEPGTSARRLILSD